MDNKEISDILSGANTALKKELLDKLVASLLRDLSETEKKDVLRDVLASRKGTGQVFDMVER